MSTTTTLLLKSGILRSLTVWLCPDQKWDPFEPLDVSWRDVSGALVVPLSLGVQSVKLHPPTRVRHLETLKSRFFFSMMWWFMLNKRSLTNGKSLRFGRRNPSVYQPLAVGDGLQGFFWTFRKNSKPKKLKQIIQKLNNLPTKNWLFAQKSPEVDIFCIKNYPNLSLKL